MCFFIIWSSFSVVQDRNSKNPHNGLVTSPDPFFLLPRCCPATELSTTTKFHTKQPRRIKPRKAQRRRRTHTCAHQCWTEKSNSGTSDVESSSELLSPDTFESNKRLIVVIVFFSSVFYSPVFFVFRFHRVWRWTDWPLQRISHYSQSKLFPLFTAWPWRLHQSATLHWGDR